MKKAWYQQPDVRLYFSGQTLIVAGAYLMDLTGSMWPIAFAASAALMMTAPLVKRLARAGARR